MAAYDNSRRYMEALTRVGAFDSIMPNRRALLQGLDTVLDYAGREHSRRESGQIDLFEISGEDIQEPSIPDTQNFSPIQLLSLEKEMLGVYLSCNPAELFAAQLAEDSVFLADLGDVSVGQQISFVAMLAANRRIVAKNGKPMSFALFEDATGDAEGVIFGESELREGSVYFVTGRVTMRNDRRSLVVDKTFDAERMPPQRRRTLFLQFASAGDPHISEAESILAEYRGVAAAKLCFADTRTVIDARGVRGVRICSRLVDRLVRLLGNGNVIMK